MTCLEKAISEFQKPSLLKRGQVQNLSCENEFYLHDNKKNHFHKKGFVLGIVLKQRLAASRKWPIDLTDFSITSHNYNLKLNITRFRQKNNYFSLPLLQARLGRGKPVETGGHLMCQYILTLQEG